MTAGVTMRRKGSIDTRNPPRRTSPRGTTPAARARRGGGGGGGGGEVGRRLRLARARRPAGVRAGSDSLRSLEAHGPAAHAALEMHARLDTVKNYRVWQKRWAA